MHLQTELHSEIFKQVVAAVKENRVDVAVKIKQDNETRLSYLTVCFIPVVS